MRLFAGLCCLLIPLIVFSCRSGPVMDPSLGAAQAGDSTLVMSACSAMPGLGGDICRVIEGQPITAVWRIILPTNTLGGELTATYRDVSRSYAVKAGQAVLEIAFADFFGSKTWDGSMDGVIEVLGQLNYKNAQGIVQLWWARGFANIVVTKAGYDVLPVDSGFVANLVTCRIQYTTAGRAALSCR